MDSICTIRILRNGMFYEAICSCSWTFSSSDMTRLSEEAQRHAGLSTLVLKVNK